MFNIKIILEGSDASGKSSVAEKLKEQLGFDIIHGSSFESATNGNQYLYNFHKNVLSNENVIIDRSTLSNLVYAPIFKDYDMLTKQQNLELLEEHKDNIVIVYLYADEDVIIERLQKRGDDYVSAENIKPILDSYKLVIQEAIENSIPVLHFDTGQLSSDEVVNEVVNVTNNLETHVELTNE